MGAASWKGATPLSFIPLKMYGRRFFPGATRGAVPFQQLVTTTLVNSQFTPELIPSIFVDTYMEIILESSYHIDLQTVCISH